MHHDPLAPVQQVVGRWGALREPGAAHCPDTRHGHTAAPGSTTEAIAHRRLFRGTS